MKKDIGPQVPAQEHIQAGGIIDRGLDYCKCGRVMEESTRSQHGQMHAGLMELRCPAGCMTRTRSRATRHRVNTQLGAGRRVRGWV